MKIDDKIYLIIIFSFVLVLNHDFCHIQGGPKSKPQSRIIIKSY